MSGGRTLRGAWLAALIAALVAAGCGRDGEDGDTETQTRTTTVETTRVEVVEGLGGNGAFDPAAIYERVAPGVVTVISVFGDGAAPGPGDRGLGSGFVLSSGGAVLTNAHVVTEGEGGDIAPAEAVFVRFDDGNSVRARILGQDPFSDIGLLRVDPSGLTLRPLPLAEGGDLRVGEPVAAIGSPFGEPQSLSVGVISALDRTIDSLTNFQISGAVQTDAAINRGNSGGPLVNARGEVIGINSQIRSTGGGGEGVGFAVPIDAIRRSLADLLPDGEVSYPFVGVSTVTVFPQLAGRFDLGVDHGAWIQELTPDSPADDAGLRAGEDEQRFQVQLYTVGGDVISAVDGRPVTIEDDLSELLIGSEPGETVTFEVYRDGERREVDVRLGERPLEAPSEP